MRPAIHPHPGSEHAEDENVVHYARRQSGVHARRSSTGELAEWRNEQQDLLEVLRWNLEAAHRALENPAEAPHLQQLTRESLIRARECCAHGKLLLSRLGQQSGAHPISVVQLVRSTVALARGGLEERMVVHEALPDEEFTVEGDRARLQGVLLGLLIDAHQETPEGEPWRHDLVIRGRRDGPMFQVEIQVLRGAPRGPLAAEEEEELERRLVRYAAVLQSHQGFLDADDTGTCRTMRFHLPLQITEDPSSQRPTRRLPTSKSPQPHEGIHEQPTARPPAPEECAGSPGPEQLSEASEGLPPQRLARGILR